RFDPIPPVVTLVDGRFSIPVVPGAAARASVSFVESTVGAIGGSPAAVVVLYGTGGGSGGIFSAHVVDATGKTVASVNTGDRHPIEMVSINAAGQIGMDVLESGPRDPACCPTQRVHRVYDLRGSVLVRVDVPAPAATGNAGRDGAQHTSVAFEVMLLAILLAGIGVARSLGRVRQRELQQ
ncbi:MAG: hypothetical protein WCQ48_06075, partial [Chloroflexota bacterium]